MFVKEEHEFDITVHGEHRNEPVEHSRSWYETWGDKCPVCGVEPVFERRIVEIEVIDKGFVRMKSETDAAIS